MNTNDLESTQNLFAFLDVIKRRKFTVFLPFIILTPAIIIGGTFLPKLYRASTTILVEPQKVPAEYVKPIISVPVEERLKTIIQQVMSRSRLMMIVNDLNLLGNNASALAMENMIAKLQEDIEVEVKGTSYFQISCVGRNPRKIMLIANKTASLFIEENLKVSERQAQSTANFITEELDKVKEQLEEREEILRQYKQDHMGQLPAQEEANLRALDRLQLQVQNNNQSLRDLEAQEILLEKQLSDEKPYNILGDMAENGNAGSPVIARLNLLKSELEFMKTRYSDEWPRIKQVKEEIASLEAKLKEQPVKEDTDKELMAETKVENPAYKALKQSLDKVKINIKNVKSAQAKLSQEIAAYRRRVENIPKVEQELISLTRDYEMTKSKYESLLNKKLEAKLSESLETKQKGETFKILDAAEIPLTPDKPNMLQVVLVAIFAGLGLGVGLAWLQETMDHSLKGTEDCEKYLGVQALGIISNITTKEDAGRKRMKRFAVLFVLLIYFGFLRYVYQNKAEIKKFIKLNISSSHALLMEK